MRPFSFPAIASSLASSSLSNERSIILLCTREVACEVDLVDRGLLSGFTLFRGTAVGLGERHHFESLAARGEERGMMSWGTWHLDG